MGSASRTRLRRAAGFVGILATLTWIGCATEVGHHTFLKGPRPPRAADARIEVFTNGLPTRPFDRVAILEAHCESQGFLEPNLEHDALPILKRQAREAGCDAIIEIQVRRPQNWSFETKSIHFTATGIAYQ